MSSEKLNVKFFHTNWKVHRQVDVTSQGRGSGSDALPEQLAAFDIAAVKLS